MKSIFIRGFVIDVFIVESISWILFVHQVILTSSRLLETHEIWIALDKVDIMTLLRHDIQDNIIVVFALLE